MEITCLQCNFARNIPDEKIPDRAEMATCPKCRHKFRFRKLDPDASAQIPPSPSEEQTSPDQPEPSQSLQLGAAGYQAGSKDSEELWDRVASLGQPHQDGPSPQADPLIGRRTDESFPEIEVPWERLDTFGFFFGIWETIKRAMLQPAIFFHSMPLGRGQIKPLIFYLLIAGFQIVMHMLWNMFGIGTHATPEAGIAGTMIMLVVYPLILTVLLYFMAALVHLSMGLVGVVTRGFEGTLRALTYGSAPMILVVIPMIGPLIGAIWSIVVTFLGYKHIHRTSTVKVLAAMLLSLFPFAFVLFMVLIIIH